MVEKEGCAKQLPQTYMGALIVPVVPLTGVAGPEVRSCLLAGQLSLYFSVLC